MISEEDYEEFLSNAKSVNTHPAKLIILTKMLNELFGLELKELIKGIEVYIKGKKKNKDIIKIQRGRVDLLLPEVIIELKVDFDKELPDAMIEIQKYFEILYEKDPTKSYIAIITDLIIYNVYEPCFDDKGNIKVNNKPNRTLNAEKTSLEDFIIWIDSYFFTRENITPTARDLNLTFGTSTLFYNHIERKLIAMWDKVEKLKNIQLKYVLWLENMKLVYGDVPDFKTFIAHTYLVNLIKLIAYLKLDPEVDIKLLDIEKLVRGSLFIESGIINLIENDYFSWITHSKIIKESVNIVKDLLISLKKYNLKELDVDIFKEIYEVLVELGQRHKIGEYYTPEWLSELTLKRVYKLWKDSNQDKIPKILDPACGSGTFLTNAIKLFKKQFGSKSPKELLLIITSNIIGIDINPIAIITSRANYLIALGDDLLYCGEKIFIPIYNTDSIKIPQPQKTLLGDNLIIETDEEDHPFLIPLKIVEEAKLFQEILEIYQESFNLYLTALQNKKTKKQSKEFAFNKFNELIQKIKDIWALTNDNIKVLRSNIEVLIYFKNKEKDSIWIFIMNNVFFSYLEKERKCDIIIGNPPWIVLRSFKGTEYKNFLKKTLAEYKLSPKPLPKIYKTKTIPLDKWPDLYLSYVRNQLITQMEIATLFYQRTADLYLDKDGLIGFLLPISTIIGYNQHVLFRKFEKPQIKLLEILNFVKVYPIFSLPTCCLIGKKGNKTVYPVDEYKYEANLSNYDRNAKYSVVKALIKKNIQKNSYSPPELPKKFSYFYNDAFVGASLFPRVFWFVEFDTKSKMPILISTPRLITNSNLISKEPWAKITLKGTVEADFIYTTLLGKDIVPFGCLNYRPIVIPLKINKATNQNSLIKITDLSYPNLNKWVNKAQDEWVKNRTKKSEKNFPTVIDRLNYQKTLEEMPLSKKFFVVWNARGADSFAYLIDTSKLTKFQFIQKGQKKEISLKGFVPDITLYCYATNDEGEANYISAVINSPLIHKAVKPFQPRGQYGYRDIGKRVLMISIPKYDKINKKHKRLEKLSKECHDLVKKLSLNKNLGFRKIRNILKEKLKAKYKEIDQITSEITGINLDILEDVETNNTLEEKDEENDEFENEVL
ncbi:MAG: N-6 DNA methylase [Promethearchaeota archaeon]